MIRHPHVRQRRERVHRKLAEERRELRQRIRLAARLIIGQRQRIDQLRPQIARREIVQAAFVVCHRCGPVLFLLASPRLGHPRLWQQFGAGELPLKLLEQRAGDRRPAGIVRAFRNQQDGVVGEIAVGISPQNPRQSGVCGGGVIQRQIGAQALVKRQFAQRPAHGGKICIIIHH